ncbi:hypothetical protein BDQ17DRAFT_1357388, partial [Cyathus striatus]
MKTGSTPPNTVPPPSITVQPDHHYHRHDHYQPSHHCQCHNHSTPTSATLSSRALHGPHTAPSMSTSGHQDNVPITVLHRS